MEINSKLERKVCICGGPSQNDEVWRCVGMCVYIYICMQ
jgi:hypothetical protein